MSETWSAKPFVSYDGLDQNGYRAEVKVHNGRGYVKEINNSKETNAQIVFKIDSLEYPVAAWAPANSKLVELAAKAQAENFPIEFRIEIRRKDKVDRSIPIMELSKSMESAKKNCHRAIAAVRADETSEWIISRYARTRIDEDPTTGSPSAYDFTPEQLNPQQKTNTPTENNHSYSTIENAPTSILNPNNTINPGSHAVHHILENYQKTKEYYKTNEIDVDDKIIFNITQVITNTINKLQLSIYNGELITPDPNAPSYKQAQELVFYSLQEFTPLNPVNITPEELTQWEEKTLEKTLGMWRWSIKTIEKIIQS